MRYISLSSTLLLSLVFIYSCGTDVNDNDLDPNDNFLEFELDSNGITIKCPDANAGDMGIVDGVKYEAVDNNLLRQRRDEGSDLTKVCVSLVTDMSNLFADTDFNQSIGNWDVSTVTDMSGMFSHSQFNQPIGEWNVSNVTDMNEMFWSIHFNKPIGNWDVSSVTNMSRMFRSSIFNHPIDEWNVSSVELMSYMFWNSNFHQPIGDWDVRNVTDMRGMFLDTRFNNDISGWCVWRIETEQEKFSYNCPLTPENKPKWGTCPD